MTGYVVIVLDGVPVRVVGGVIGPQHAHDVLRQLDPIGEFEAKINRYGPDSSLTQYSGKFYVVDKSVRYRLVGDKFVQC